MGDWASERAIRAPAGRFWRFGFSSAPCNDALLRDWAALYGLNFLLMDFSSFVYAIRSHVGIFCVSFCR